MPSSRKHSLIITGATHDRSQLAEVKSLILGEKMVFGLDFDLTSTPLMQRSPTLFLVIYLPAVSISDKI